MPHIHFRFHTGDGQWSAGATFTTWAVYVRRFFAQWPSGELEWTHDA